MAKTKSTIVSIMQKTPPAFKQAAVFFPVNGQPLNADGVPCTNENNESLFPNVSKISFCKHEYGSGAVVNRPCYLVEFENSPQVIVIYADDVAQVSVFRGSVEANEGVPALPEE